MSLRNQRNALPTFRQAPFPQATIGSKPARRRSLGWYIVNPARPGSIPMTARHGPEPTGVLAGTAEGGAGTGGGAASTAPALSDMTNRTPMARRSIALLLSPEPMIRQRTADAGRPSPTARASPMLLQIS